MNIIFKKIIFSEIFFTTSKMSSNQERTERIISQIEKFSRNVRISSTLPMKYILQIYDKLTRSENVSIYLRDLTVEPIVVKLLERNSKGVNVRIETRKRIISLIKSGEFKYFIVNESLDNRRERIAYRLKKYNLQQEQNKQNEERLRRINAERSEKFEREQRKEDEIREQERIKEEERVRRIREEILRKKSLIIEQLKQQEEARRIFIENERRRINEEIKRYNQKKREENVKQQEKRKYERKQREEVRENIAKYFQKKREENVRQQRERNLRGKYEDYIRELAEYEFLRRRDEDEEKYVKEQEEYILKNSYNRKNRLNNLINNIKSSLDINSFKRITFNRDEFLRDDYIKFLEAVLEHYKKHPEIIPNIRIRNINLEDGSINENFFVLNVNLFNEFRRYLRNKDIEDYELIIDEKYNSYKIEDYIKNKYAFYSNLVSITVDYKYLNKDRNLKKRRGRRTGGYFKYIHNIEGLDLSPFQIYTKEEITECKEDFNKHCLYKTFEEYNRRNNVEIKEEFLEELAYNLSTQFTKIIELNELFKKYKILIIVYKKNMENGILSRTYYGCKNEKYKHKVKIGLVDNHFFLHMKINKNLGEYKTQQKTSTSIIQEIYENKEKYLTPIGIEYDILNTPYHPLHNISDEKNIKSEHVEEYKTVRKRSYLDKDFIFCADIETYVDENNFHIPFMISVNRLYDNLNYFDKFTFTGENCINTFLIDMLREVVRICEEENYEKIPKVVIYFHNLGFDGSFIIRSPFFKPYNIIQPTNSKIFMINGAIIYERRKIDVSFRCSVALFGPGCALKNLPKMFKLDCGNKGEAIPFTYFNSKNINKALAKVEDVVKHIKPEEKHIFDKALEEEDYYYEDGREMFILDYMSKYCEQDVEILRQSLIKFNEMCENDELFNFNAYDSLTISSLAIKTAELNNCFEGCYKYNKTLAYYARNFIVGGRVMGCENKYPIKINVEKNIDEISDNDYIQIFDAVSLYPSAMKFFDGFPVGKPKYINMEEKPYSSNKFKRFIEKNEICMYLVKINVTKIGKKRKFPLVSVIDENVRMFENKEGIYYVSKYALEDLEEFQEIKYEVLNIIYYNEGFNNNINNFIQNLFNLRLNAKNENPVNPIENLYKLCMNSIYGKLIQKIITDECVIKNNEDELKNYLLNNKEFINKYINFAKEKYIINVVKNVKNYSNFSLGGILILDYSKRLMNRVICLAEDNNIDIFYQDTDSIHLKNKDVEKLFYLFREKYGENLNGKNMGNFHIDLKHNGNDAIGLKGIFLAKKSYCYELRDMKTGEIGYKICYKGVPEKVIYDICEKRNITPIQLYENISNGIIYHVNLCSSTLQMRHDKKFSIKNNKLVLMSLKMDNGNVKYIDDYLYDIDKINIESEINNSEDFGEKYEINENNDYDD